MHDPATAALEADATIDAIAAREATVHAGEERTTPPVVNAFTQDDPAPEDLVVLPGTGEVIDLKATTTTGLADGFELIRGLELELSDAKRAVVNEVARRLDLENSRTVDLFAGEVHYTLKTNAPSVEEYPLDRLREVLEVAVANELISADVVDRIITTPEPVEPAPRVDKRELNKLIKRPELERLVARVRIRKPQNRTLSVEVHNR